MKITKAKTFAPGVTDKQLESQIDYGDTMLLPQASSRLPEAPDTIRFDVVNGGVYTQEDAKYLLYAFINTSLFPIKANDQFNRRFIRWLTDDHTGRIDKYSDDTFDSLNQNAFRDLLSLKVLETLPLFLTEQDNAPDSVMEKRKDITLADILRGNDKELYVNYDIDSDSFKKLMTTVAVQGLYLPKVKNIREVLKDYVEESQVSGGFAEFTKRSSVANALLETVDEAKFEQAVIDYATNVRKDLQTVIQNRNWDVKLDVANEVSQPFLEAWSDIKSDIDIDGKDAEKLAGLVERLKPGSEEDVKDIMGNESVEVTLDFEELDEAAIVEIYNFLADIKWPGLQNHLAKVLNRVIALYNADLKKYLEGITIIDDALTRNAIKEVLPGDISIEEFMGDSEKLPATAEQRMSTTITIQEYRQMLEEILEGLSLTGPSAKGAWDLWSEAYEGIGVDLTRDRIKTPQIKFDIDIEGIDFSSPMASLEVELAKIKQYGSIDSGTARDEMRNVQKDIKNVFQQKRREEFKTAVDKLDVLDKKLAREYELENEDSEIPYQSKFISEEEFEEVSAGEEDVSAKNSTVMQIRNDELESLKNTYVEISERVFKLFGRRASTVDDYVSTYYSDRTASAEQEEEFRDLLDSLIEDSRALYEEYNKYAKLDRQFFRPIQEQMAAINRIDTRLKRLRRGIGVEPPGAENLENLDAGLDFLRSEFDKIYREFSDPESDGALNMFDRIASAKLAKEKIREAFYREGNFPAQLSSPEIVTLKQILKDNGLLEDEYFSELTTPFNELLTMITDDKVKITEGSLPDKVLDQIARQTYGSALSDPGIYGEISLKATMKSGSLVVEVTYKPQGKARQTLTARGSIAPGYTTSAAMSGGRGERKTRATRDQRAKAKAKIKTTQAINPTAKSQVTQYRQRLEKLSRALGVN